MNYLLFVNLTTNQSATVGQATTPQRSEIKKCFVAFSPKNARVSAPIRTQMREITVSENIYIEIAHGMCK